MNATLLRNPASDQLLVYFIIQLSEPKEILAGVFGGRFVGGRLGQVLSTMYTLGGPPVSLVTSALTPIHIAMCW